MLHIAEKHFKPVKKLLNVLSTKYPCGKKNSIQMEAANMLQAAVYDKIMMSMNISTDTIITIINPA